MGGVLGPFLRPLGPGGYQPQTLSLQPILSRAPHEHSETSIGNQRITCSYGDWKWMNIVRLGEIRTSLGLDFQATNSDTNSGHPVSNITFCFCKDFGFGRLGPYVFSFQMEWWSNMFFQILCWPFGGKTTHISCVEIINGIKDHQATCFYCLHFDLKLCHGFPLSVAVAVALSVGLKSRTATHAMERGEENWGRGIVLPEQHISLLRTFSVDGSCWICRCASFIFRRGLRDASSRMYSKTRCHFFPGAEAAWHCRKGPLSQLGSNPRQVVPIGPWLTHEHWNFTRKHGGFQPFWSFEV